MSVVLLHSGKVTAAASLGSHFWNLGYLFPFSPPLYAPVFSSSLALIAWSLGSDMMMRAHIPQASRVLEGLLLPRGPST